MPRIALVDRDDDEIVEDTLGGKVHVHDLGMRLLDERQKDPLAGEPEVVILHGRLTDDRREVRGPLPLGHARQMEHRKVVRLGIEAGVVAERTFPPALTRLDVAFEDDVSARGDVQVVRHALHHLDAASGEKASKEQFVQAFRHGGGGAICQDRLGAERDGNVEATAEAFGHAVMLRTAFVALPMHAGRSRVEHLHPIGADVSHACFRILGEDKRQRDVRAAVLGPAFQDRQAVERSVPPNDFLAGSVLDGLRHQIAQAADNRQHLERVHDALWHLRREERVDLRREVVERLHAERQAHALERSEYVGRDRHVEARWPLEEERRPTLRHLASSVGHCRDFEVGADRLANPDEQHPLREVGQKLVEVSVHG